jgi:hypothetical protein
MWLPRAFSYAFKLDGARFLHQQTLPFRYGISAMISRLLIGCRKCLALKQEPARSRLGR